AQSGLSQRSRLSLLAGVALASATTALPRPAEAGDRSGRTRFALPHTVTRLLLSAGVDKAPAAALAERYAAQPLARRLDEVLRAHGAHSPTVARDQPERATVQVRLTGGAATLVASLDGRLSWDLRVGRGYPEADAPGVGRSTTLLDGPDGRATHISVFTPAHPKDAALLALRAFVGAALARAQDAEDAQDAQDGSPLRAALAVTQEQLAGRELGKHGRVWTVASLPGERAAAKGAPPSSLERLLGGTDPRGHLPEALRLWLAELWEARSDAARAVEATLLLSCVEPYRSEFDDARSPSLAGALDRRRRTLLARTAAVGLPSAPLAALFADPVLASLAATATPPR
ncbi:MAG: hypothetical protein IPL40_09070, partial [Proteobacteria bacterium]|nr:hypothetical protein [Pseudomonadota bacterium]